MCQSPATKVPRILLPHSGLAPLLMSQHLCLLHLALLAAPPSRATLWLVSVFSNIIYLIPSSCTSPNLLIPSLHPSNSSPLHPNDPSPLHPSNPSPLHPFILTTLHPFIPATPYSFIPSLLHPSNPSPLHRFILTTLHPFTQQPLIPSSLYPSNPSSLHPSNPSPLHPNDRSDDTSLFLQYVYEFHHYVSLGDILYIVCLAKVGLLSLNSQIL